MKYAQIRDGQEDEKTKGGDDEGDDVLRSVLLSVSCEKQVSNASLTPEEPLTSTPYGPLERMNRYNFSTEKAMM